MKYVVMVEPANPDETFQRANNTLFAIFPSGWGRADAAHLFENRSSAVRTAKRRHVRSGWYVTVREVISRVESATGVALTAGPELWPNPDPVSLLGQIRSRE